MIKRLRRKLIAVTMASLCAVLALIIGIINTVNYVRVVRNADGIVSLLKAGGGQFGIEDGGKDPFDKGHQKPMSPETPFETRFFTVTVDADGTAQAINTDRIVAVSAEEAARYAENLYQRNKTSGFYGRYRYGTLSTETDETMYIFVDCTKDLNGVQNILIVSIGVGIAALLLVFVLVLLLSGKVMKPIAESYEKQKRFITDASHEIKTPLTIIGADAAVLEMQGTANEWTESIKEQVQSLTSLTEKLVFLARMDEAGGTLNATDFSISDAAEETVKLFCAPAIARGLQIRSEIQKNVTYCGDESLIRQLLSLLLDNALKYSVENGVIAVGMKSAGGKIRITVANPSDGPNGDLDVLFERFYRNDKSRNSLTGGHGIGLSVAKTIVAAHKGKISAHGENGTVTFTVVL